MTRRVRTWDTESGIDGKWAVGTSEYNSLLNGEYFVENYNLYTANICGFDMRADGGYVYGDGFNGAGSNAAMWLGGDGKCLLSFNTWEVFESDILSSQNLFSTPYAKKMCFYPIRFFMKFDGQADTGGGVSVSSLAKGLATKSSSAPVESRDVYVGLEAVEE